jgi:GNAT superfamily N-acetyltransferase
MRRATTRDVNRLARVYVRSQHEDNSAAGRDGITQETVASWLGKAVASGEVWLLERQYGEFAGVLALSGDELDMLDVAPDLRGRGFGAQLMEQAKSRRPGGLIANVADSRHHARAFLTYHGFHAMRVTLPGIEEFAWGPGTGRRTQRPS